MRWLENQFEDIQTPEPDPESLKDTLKNFVNIGQNFGTYLHQLNLAIQKNLNLTTLNFIEPLKTNSNLMVFPKPPHWQAEYNQNNFNHAAMPQSVVMKRKKYKRNR